VPQDHENSAAINDDLAAFIGRDLISSGVSCDLTAADEVAAARARNRLMKESLSGFSWFFWRFYPSLSAVIIIAIYQMGFWFYPALAAKLPDPISLLAVFALWIFYLSVLRRIGERWARNGLSVDDRSLLRVAGVHDGVLWISRAGELVSYSRAKTFYAIKEFGDHISVFIDPFRSHTFNRALLMESETGQKILDWLADAPRSH